MSLSRFLPADFDPAGKVVLLAGRGNYPRLVWQRLLECRLDAHVIALEASANVWTDAIPADRKTFINVGQIGKLLHLLKQLKARYVYLAGQITPGKLFQQLKPDFKAIWLLARLKEKNASTIFGAVVREIEALGITVLDARSFLDEHLAHSGEISAVSSIKIADYELQQGIAAARALAAADIGQGLVICRGTIIAAEAFEGTDAMLERAGSLCHKPMGFIKLAKNNQDFRFDVPSFGLKTLKHMKASGITWAALEANNVLIINKDIVLSEAKSLGIKIIGFQ